MSDSGVAWAGLASLVIHLVQGGIQIAKHFRLTSECCGRRSGVSWDVGTPPEDKSSTAEAGLAEPPQALPPKKVSFRSPTPPPGLPLGGRPAGE